MGNKNCSIRYGRQGYKGMRGWLTGEFGKGINKAVKIQTPLPAEVTKGHNEEALYIAGSAEGKHLVT